MGTGIAGCGGLENVLIRAAGGFVSVCYISTKGVVKSSSESADMLFIEGDCLFIA